MHAAEVTGLCISVFNNNVPVFTKAFGLANAPKNEPLKTTSILSAASFSKAEFAYIVMKLVEEKVIDLDTPLVSYIYINKDSFYKIKMLCILLQTFKNPIGEHYHL